MDELETLLLFGIEAPVAQGSVLCRGNYSSLGDSCPSEARRPGLVLRNSDVLPAGRQCRSPKEEVDSSSSGSQWDSGSVSHLLPRP